MLTLTDGATRAISGLLSDRGPAAGLRISSEPAPGGNVQLTLALADYPEPTDEVVEQSGSRVFLDEQAAPLVDGRTLDMRATEGERVVRFSFVGE